MNLAASLIVHNERGRYLDACVDHLLGFCDQILIVDDGSTDQTVRHLQARLDDRIHVRQTAHTFFEHEGKARQQLIDWTLAGNPTHVLSIDADEFVSDGSELRACLEAQPDQLVWQLQMEEVWQAGLTLAVRADGGWRPHGVPFLWKAPAPGTKWTMRDRKLACGRIPTQVMAQGAGAKPTGVSLLHFGWADESDRERRYARYAKHDGGRFHARSHLESTRWKNNDPRLRLVHRPWPNGSVFDRLRERFMVTA